MKRILLCALPLFVGLLALAATEGAAPQRGWDNAPSGKEIQDVLYMSEVRPVLLRLRVRVDGRPVLAAWEEFIDRLFAYLDIDGDGVLGKAEAERAPPISALFAGGVFFGGGGGAVNVTEMDADKDGKVTRQELAEYYRKSGAMPFQIGAGAGATEYLTSSFLDVGGGRPSADALNKRLFELLDTDKDGKLSKEELAAAPKLLQRLDADDDEVLTSSELMGQTNAYDGAAGFAFIGGPGRMGSTNNGAFIPVTSGKPNKLLAKMLLDKYGKGKKKLTREQLGLDKATFEVLDVDGDGNLDQEELARFANRPADLVFAVRVGKAGGKPALELLAPGGKASALAENVKKVREGELLFELGNIRIELAGVAPAAGMNFGFDIKAQYSAQFKAADRDNNGYLDEKEARMNPLFGNSFKAMDRDGDGKLFEKEVLAYLDQMEDLRKAAEGGCAHLNVTDRGRGLFDLVDKDGDSRLSLRELRGMVKLLSLDRDGDGKLGMDEVPRSYRADFQRGPAGSMGYAGAVVAFSPDGSPVRPVAARSEGPLWFRKMDRNRDGDVSRREFLGTDEEFARIDTDGDGLISLAEAVAFDKMMREKRKSKD